MPTSDILVLALLLLAPCEAEPATEFLEASDGGTASLPCNLTPVVTPDKVSVVLWYKGADESPMYKYDLRGGQPARWAAPALQNRYFLRVLDDTKAAMSISPARLEDEQTFHCRVDFLQSPTRVTHVNLTIVVPPSNVQVSDDWGPVRNGITTAYAEGASLTLTCVATAGKPLARVSWYRDGELVANETAYFPARRQSRGALKIEKLTRAHLLAVYSCEAGNSRLQPPLVVRAAVDMYLRPLEVELVGGNPEFSAGRRYDVSCRCVGSRPPAIITWWKDGISLEGGIVTVSADGNTTTSTLSFTPTSADHGLILTCKAFNQRIPFSEQTRTWMMRVFYPPKVTLTLGHGLNANDIKEGADVYFECHLIANPWVTRVRWIRDGERLFSNTTAGVIVTNQTLVLQGVTRASAGRYCCEASNKEGTSRSAPFHLRVKFEPICVEGALRRVVGAAKDEPLKVECNLDAEPVANSFRWSFNSTPGIAKDLTDFTEEIGSTSVLTYVPRVAADYGTIQCWGVNAIGPQTIPCTFHIVPAGKPDPPQGCTVANVTHNFVWVTCKKGFDGGLRQKFLLVLSSGESIIANVSTSTTPDFNISNLDPSKDYSATIRSMNSKGVSRDSMPLLFRTQPTPGLKEQRRSTEPNDGSKAGSGPWLYILLAAGSTLIVAAAVGAIIIAVRKFRVDSPVRNPRSRSPKMEESPLTPHVQPLYTDTISDDNNPDLIPDAPNSEALLNTTIVPYTITARQSSKRNCATQMPVKPYHVTWAPMLQSRNCSTQTPPPHKESSV